MKILQKKMKVLSIWVVCSVFLMIFGYRYQGLSSENEEQISSELMQISPGSSKNIPTQIQRLNINLAGEIELQQLQGIGPVLAHEIVVYRRESGAYENVEDLLKVTGIGPKTVSNIRDEIFIGPQSPKIIDEPE